MGAELAEGAGVGVCAGARAWAEDAGGQLAAVGAVSHLDEHIAVRLAHANQRNPFAIKDAELVQLLGGIRLHHLVQVAVAAGVLALEQHGCRRRRGIDALVGCCDG